MIGCPLNVTAHLLLQGNGEQFLKAVTVHLYS